MDLRNAEMNGLEALREIRSSLPETRIVILTTYDDDESMLEGFRDGASAFLLKDTIVQHF